MGLFCANMHFQTDDDQAVRLALSEAVADLEVLPADNGWVSVYAAGLLEGGAATIEPLAAAATNRLGTRAVSFWVYDSDIAQYWLHDEGELCDQYDSWPGYFDDAPPEPTGGNPETLQKFCGPGTDIASIRSLLRSESPFADDVVAGLATMLRVTPERAVTDYRDVAEQRHHLPDLGDALGAGISLVSAPDGDHDPDAIALVQAAAAGDETALRRLVSEASAIDVPAPTPLPGGQALAGLGMAVTGTVPEVLMTPLLAAVANRQHAAIALLLDAGADPNQAHELYGTAVHAAVGAGDAQTLRLLLDHGGDPAGRDAHGQTPLEALEQGRRSIDAMVQLQAGLEALGMDVPDLMEQLATAGLPTEGWDACEEILRARDGDA